MGPFIIDG